MSKITKCFIIMSAFAVSSSLTNTAIAQDHLETTCQDLATDYVNLYLKINELNKSINRASAQIRDTSYAPILSLGGATDLDSSDLGYIRRRHDRLLKKRNKLIGNLTHIHQASFSACTPSERSAKYIYT